MSALTDALTHAANRPFELVTRLAGMVNPGADLTGLHDAGGVICDFRPGLEEHNPSLSVDMQAGGAVFHRFGADGFEGGALAFVMSCLGVGKGEAARLLIEWAGIIDTPPAKGQAMNTGPTLTPKAQAGAVKVLEAVSKWQPLSEDQRQATLKGWAKLTGDG